MTPSVVTQRPFGLSSRTYVSSTTPTPLFSISRIMSLRIVQRTARVFQTTHFHSGRTVSMRDARRETGTATQVTLTDLGLRSACFHDHMDQREREPVAGFRTEVDRTVVTYFGLGVKTEGSGGIVVFADALIGEELRRESRIPSDCGCGPAKLAGRAAGRLNHF